MSARTSSMPSCAATALRRALVVAGRHDDPQPALVQGADRLRRRRLDRVGDGDEPGQPCRRRRRTSPSCLPSAARRPVRSAPPTSTSRSVHHRPVAERDAGAADRAGNALAGDRLRSPPPSSTLAPRSSAPSTIASASGCSDPVSRLAASASTSPRRSPRPRPRRSAPAGPRSACRSCRRSACRPSQNRSSASASLISTPACAPRPVAVMIDIGVASPSAQGQAMISTDTAETMAKIRLGSGPNIAQATKASDRRPARRPARSRTTPGRPGPGSARGCAAPWRPSRRCATASCRRRPSRPRMTSEPFLLSVPPVTASPSVFSTGSGSPVIIDSSTDERPSITLPSTGMLSPGRTRSRSPALHVVERHVRLGSVLADAPRRLRRQVEQRADRRAGPLARPQLQHLAEEDQRDDDRRRLEIDRHRAAMAAELVREDARKQRRDDAVEIGRADAERDQRPHVRAAVDDRFVAAMEERHRRPQHHRRRQRQFDPGRRRLADPVAEAAGRASVPW